MVKKILVIEDDAQTRNLFLGFLKAEGFYTISAENGYIGVQQAQEHLPDLIICKIMMPQLDGYGVLTTLRQEPSSAIIPFIFVTDKVTRADLRKGMELGADDYLTKPCTLEELLRAIAARLEKQATLQQWYIAKFQPVPKPPSVDTVKPTAPQSVFPSAPHLSEIFRFLETNYHRQISLDDVAQIVGYSSSYLTQLVRRQTGKTVYRWIVERRMAAARSMLVETNQTVDQISVAVGYQDASHFFQQFRQLHGTTPLVWRKSHRFCNTTQ